MIFIVHPGAYILSAFNKLSPEENYWKHPNLVRLLSATFWYVLAVVVTLSLKKFGFVE